jgi:hypothetical protein
MHLCLISEHQLHMQLQHAFFILDTPLTSPILQIIGTYDRGLVTLSVIVAVLSAYAALDLAGRVTSAHGRDRHLWLIGGAATMGIGKPPSRPAGRKLSTSS